jgi:hypothetical protein
MHVMSTALHCSRHQRSNGHCSIEPAAPCAAQEYCYGIGVAEPVATRVQQVKATPGMALGGVNRKAHCKNRRLPEMVAMAVLTLGIDGSTVLGL